MGTIYYIMAIVGVWIIVDWYIANDARTDTIGILKVKEPD